MTATQPPVWTAEDRHKALTRAMVADLGDLIRRLAADDQAGLLSCAAPAMSPSAPGSTLRRWRATWPGSRSPVMPCLYEGIPGCPKPMVAMLNGDAVGGGLQPALSCDIIVAHAGVRVGCRKPSWAPCSGMASWRSGPGRRGRRSGPAHHRRTSG
jgi:enoyl-CoA hydratase